MIEDLINDIGTGLNESAIRNRLLTLREQAEAQDTRLKELEAKVVKLESQAESEKLAPKQDMVDDVAIKFLQLLLDRHLTIAQISAALGVSKGKADLHCGRLEQADMIYLAGNEVLNQFGDVGDLLWGITQKGREFLDEKKLI